MLSNVVNERNLGRAIEGQKQAKKFYDARFIWPKRGRPTSFSPRATILEESSSTSNSAKRLRSTAAPYNSSMCIICPKEGGIFHKVETKPKGLKMFEVAKKIDGKSFFIHLNTLCNAADAVANYVQYHQRCWLYTQRNVKKTNNIHCDTDSIEINDTPRVISDIELLNVVKCEFNKKENTDLNMNNINNTYINLLQDNNHADINPNYKRYLKQLILENNPYGEFIKPRRKNESEKLCSAKERNSIIDTALENAEDIMSNIFEIVRSISKNIIKAKPSKFDDSFENYSAPEMLRTLIKWIIAGPRNELETEKRKQYIDQTANNITQLIYPATKSDSQLRYKPTSDSNKAFYNTNETLFSVSLGLLIHKKTRTKDIVNILANLSIDYEKVLRIETDITNAVVQRALKNNGVYVPPSTQASLPVYFAVDNCDFKNDTADGKNDLHGTAQIVYQQSSANVVSEKL